MIENDIVGMFVAGSRHPSWDKIFAVLGDGKPKTHRQIVRATGLGESAVWAVLNYYWKKGFILRTDKPIREYERFFKGRVGFKGAMRSYYLYLFNSGEAKSLALDGHRFVAYSEKYLDKRGARGQSKSQMILKFLEKNGDRAWYSKEIADAYVYLSLG